MKKRNILYIGNHPEILEIVVRLLNAMPGQFGIGASGSEQAQQLFCEYDIDLVLLGCGISESAESTLRAFFTNHKPGIVIVQHYGGGSGLLASEIWTALGEPGENKTE